MNHDPCAQCGAPMAPDQRYCLSCGAPRADAALPVLSGRTAQLVAYAPPGLALGPPAPPATRLTAVNAVLRDNGPLLGLTGILLIALLIGVLLGHWASAPGAAAAQPPQVISVGAAALPRDRRVYKVRDS